MWPCDCVLANEVLAHPSRKAACRSLTHLFCLPFCILHPQSTDLMLKDQEGILDPAVILMSKSRLRLVHIYLRAKGSWVSSEEALHRWPPDIFGVRQKLVFSHPRANWTCLASQIRDRTLSRVE